MSEFFIYEGNKKRPAENVICDYCGKTFLKATRFIKVGKRNFCSRKHLHEANRVKSVKINCHCCGKTFERKPSALKRSKSRLYFCSRKCKDYAQSIDGDCIEIQPSHYKDGMYSYREKALKYYDTKCSNCGYNEHIEILDVHHIDGNRRNNKIENLIVLCPTCHVGITRKLYHINENREIIKS
jgi:hypothetical protein